MFSAAYILENNIHDLLAHIDVLLSHIDVLLTQNLHSLGENKTNALGVYSDLFNCIE